MLERNKVLSRQREWPPAVKMEIRHPKIHILCIVLFLSITMAMSTADRSVHCPDQCDCPSKTLNCQGRGLERMPRFEITYHDLVSANFSHNNLTTVNMKDFSGLLPRNLDLSYNYISSISPASEEPFTFNVEETLNLSHNLLTSFPVELVNQTRYVDTIDLSHNRITSLPKKVIYYQNELTKLILAFNHVVYVHPLAFINVNSLREIDLRNNYLTQISQKVEMTSGQILLGGNPWNCDCGQKWILNNENFTNTPSPPTCHEPPLVAGQSVTSLNLEDFVCPPRYNNGSLLVQSPLGGRVELICPAEGDPEITEVMWSFRGQHPSYTIASKPDKPLIIQVTEGTVGRYWCTVWNKGGNLTMSISLSIRRTYPETTETVSTDGRFINTDLNSSQLPMPVASDFKVPILGIFALTSLLLILLFLVLGLGAYTHNLRNRLKHKRAVAREGMFSWQSSFPSNRTPYANSEQATLPVNGGYMYLLQNARQRERTCYRQDDGRRRSLMMQPSEYASTRKRVLPVAPAVAPTSGPHGMYGYDSEHLYDTLGARCLSSCSDSSSQMSVAI